MMPSVKLLTEIPAASSTDTLYEYMKTHLVVRSDRHHHVLLTFERRVQNSLFDLGLLDHVGSRLGEDELPRPRFETVPVIFNHRDAVLQKDRVKHGRFVCLI